MAATGFRYHKTYVGKQDDPKIHALAKEMKASISQTIGWLSCLWERVAAFRPDGDLSGLDDAAIRKWSTCKSRRTDFVLACNRVGFLDGPSCNRVVHNWSNYVGNANRAEIQRKYRERKLPKKEPVPDVLRNRNGPVTDRQDKTRQQQQERDKSKQQTTTQPLYAPQSPAAGPCCCSDMSTTETAESQVEAPVEKTQEAQPQAPRPAKRAENRPQASAPWVPGSPITSAQDFDACLKSHGWDRTKKTPTNHRRLEELLRPGAIAHAEILAIEPEMAAVTGNGGLALSKLIAKRKERSSSRDAVSGATMAPGREYVTAGESLSPEDGEASRRSCRAALDQVLAACAMP